MRGTVAKRLRIVAAHLALLPDFVAQVEKSNHRVILPDEWSPRAFNRLVAVGGPWKEQALARTRTTYTVSYHPQSKRRMYTRLKKMYQCGQL